MPVFAEPLFLPLQHHDGQCGQHGQGHQGGTNDAGHDDDTHPAIQFATRSWQEHQGCQTADGGDRLLGKRSASYT